MEQLTGLIGGLALANALGYRSTDSMRKAASRGSLPVTTFNVEGRKGRFAYKNDVQNWLSSLGSQDGRRIPGKERRKT